MSSFLSSKNDGPMSQMASYHEQTSYSFHGGSGNDEMASPLAAFETVIPGSKTALLREQELAASSSAQKKKEEEERIAREQQIEDDRKRQEELKRLEEER